MPRSIDKLQETSSAPAPERSALEKSAFLLELSGPQVGELHKLKPDQPTVIGRGQADLPIDHDGLAGLHCSIQPRGRGALLVELGSADGIYVDGERVREKMLGSDDRFQIGVCTTLKFAIADDMEAAVQRKMAEAALREPLTGLYNRRHFQERLAAEVAVAHRHRRPLSLLMIDVDHFQRVNDRHGHLAGDEVLKTVARALQQGIRIEDILARFGGEEFVVLAREAEQAEAVAGAGRRGQLGAGAHTPGGSRHHAPGGITVTVSVGVAQLGEDETERDLFEAADQALYKAKKNGRNRVLAAGARTPKPRRRTRK